ncbi:UNVERIFIED_CONTAM: hypothetical protein RMT77_007994 [Armadillidium vulgare]
MISVKFLFSFLMVHILADKKVNNTNIPSTLNNFRTNYTSRVSFPTSATNPAYELQMKIYRAYEEKKRANLKGKGETEDEEMGIKENIKNTTRSKKGSSVGLTLINKEIDRENYSNSKEFQKNDSVKVSNIKINENIVTKADIKDASNNIDIETNSVTDKFNSSTNDDAIVGSGIIQTRVKESNETNNNNNNRVLLKSSKTPSTNENSFVLKKDYQPVKEKSSPEGDDLYIYFGGSLPYEGNCTADDVRYDNFIKNDMILFNVSKHFDSLQSSNNMDGVHYNEDTFPWSPTVTDEQNVFLDDTSEAGDQIFHRLEMKPNSSEIEDQFSFVSTSFRNDMHNNESIHRHEMEINSSPLYTQFNNQPSKNPYVYEPTKNKFESHSYVSEAEDKISLPFYTTQSNRYHHPAFEVDFDENIKRNTNYSSSSLEDVGLKNFEYIYKSGKEKDLRKQLHRQSFDASNNYGPFYARDRNPKNTSFGTFPTVLNNSTKFQTSLTNSIKVLMDRLILEERSLANNRDRNFKHDQKNLINNDDDTRNYASDFSGTQNESDRNHFNYTFFEKYRHNLNRRTNGDKYNINNNYSQNKIETPERVNKLGNNKETNICEGIDCKNDEQSLYTLRRNKTNVFPFRTSFRNNTETKFQNKLSLKDTIMSINNNNKRLSISDSHNIPYAYTNGKSNDRIEDIDKKSSYHLSSSHYQNFNSKKFDCEDEDGINCGPKDDDDNEYLRRLDHLTNQDNFQGRLFKGDRFFRQEFQDLENMERKLEHLKEKLALGTELEGFRHHIKPIEPNCPYNVASMRIGYRCFSLELTRLTFDDALKFCSKRGGTLAQEPLDESLWAQITKAFPQYLTKEMWVGASTRDKKAGTLAFLKGKMISPSELRWHDHSSSFSKFSKSDCLALSAKSVVEFEGFPCTTKLNFICQFPLYSILDNY